MQSSFLNWNGNGALKSAGKWRDAHSSLNNVSSNEVYTNQTVC